MILSKRLPKHLLKIKDIQFSLDQNLLDLQEIVKKVKVKEMEARRQANIAKGKKPKKTEKELENELEDLLGRNRFI